MAQRVFFLNTLKEGIDPAAYEEWVQKVDYPVARRQPAISSYVVTRLEGHVTEGAELPCQYLEVIEVTSIEEYRAEPRRQRGARGAASRSGRPMSATPSPSTAR